MEKYKVIFNSSIEQFEHKDKVQYIAEGLYEEKNEYHYVEFNEPDNEGVVVLCTVHYNKDEVIISRHNGLYHEMNFIRGKHCYGLYEIGGRKIDLEYRMIEMNVDDLNIDLHFEMLIQNESAGIFNLNISLEKE